MEINVYILKNEKNTVAAYIGSLSYSRRIRKDGIKKE